MTPEQRRAHLILHGQTLQDAWKLRLKYWAEAEKFWEEGIRSVRKGNELVGKALKMHSEATNRLMEGYKLKNTKGRFFEGETMIAKGHRILADEAKMSEEGYQLIATGESRLHTGQALRDGGDKLWENAIADEFGDTTITWSHGVCILGVGERYEP